MIWGWLAEECQRSTLAKCKISGSSRTVTAVQFWCSLLYPLLLIADTTCHYDLGVSHLCLGPGPGLPLHYLPTSLLCLVCFPDTHTTENSQPSCIRSEDTLTELAFTAMFAQYWPLVFLFAIPQTVQSRELSSCGLLCSSSADISVVAVHSKTLFFFPLRRLWEHMLCR